jgi:hypothetical protein
MRGMKDADDTLTTDELARVQALIDEAVSVSGTPVAHFLFQWAWARVLSREETDLMTRYAEAKRREVLGE